MENAFLELYTEAQGLQPLGFVGEPNGEYAGRINMDTSPANLPDFSKNDGLLPTIAQDADTGEVLMLAWMNAESYAETVATGRAVYYSRSRGKLWRKGEESGHTQQVEAIFVDCDADTILLKVRQVGPACHEGYRSCFFRRHTADGFEVVAQRMVDPATVYKNRVE
jgi:phosphoribosyl-AMP cyclohydrolase